MEEVGVLHALRSGLSLSVNLGPQAFTSASQLPCHNPPLCETRRLEMARIGYFSSLMSKAREG